MEEFFHDDEFENVASSSDYTSESDSSSEDDGGREIDASQDVEDYIESQIEGDFDRFIGDIQNTSDIASSEGIPKIWDLPPSEEAEDQFQADLRAASGIGRMRNKGKGKGRSRRSGPALSHQVRALIGEGNTAYVDSNLQEAIRIMTEVIRIEPRAASAWSVLATCYRELGETEKALQIAIMGAHLRHDPEEWHALARQSRETGHVQQALYCLSKAVRLDPTNVDAIWDRASLAKEVGDLPAARNAYLAMLRHFPHDTVVLTELRHTLIEMGDLKLCASLYQDAFDHYTNVFPDGKISVTTESDVIDPALAPQIKTTENAFSSFSNFTLMELLVLADIYTSLGWYEKSIKTIRAGCRWLQGRFKQRYWDACTDDREYDSDDFNRNDNEEANGPFVKPGYYPLDVNARHRLAIARLKFGDVDEGRMHARIILAQDVTEYSPLFTEIADAYFERAMYSEARPIYETLGGDATTNSIHVLMRAAECRRNLGDTQDAVEVYEHLISVDPTNNEAKMKLAEIYESMGNPRRALDLVYQVMDSRRRRQSTRDTPTQDEIDISVPSLFSEKKRGKQKQIPTAKPRQTLSHDQILELEHQRENAAQEWYAKVRNLWDDMRKGEPEAENEWMLNAERLIEMFRETRKLFLSRGSRPFSGMVRHRLQQMDGPKEDSEEKMASRLELEIEHETQSKRTTHVKREEVFHFRKIHFKDWLSLSIEYAFLLTRHDHFSEADDVLRHLLLSMVYQRQGYQDTLRLALATCAMHARKYIVVLEMFRKLMLTYQFNNEPIRLFLATLASGLTQTDQLINNSLQKFLLREMRTHAAAVDGNVVWAAGTKRFSMKSSKQGRDMDDRDNEEKLDSDDETLNQAGLETEQAKEVTTGTRPTKNNPLLPTLYGQSLISAKSYQSAIFYLLHAFDYLKDDPLVCMSLAIASLGRAMQRQSDNRNYLVAQAMGFMANYRSLRAPSENDPHADEIEYNFGRAFHQIGLFTHAIKHYESTLRIVEKRQAERADPEYYGIAREAAYNLSLIYVITGATPLADAITRRWLTI